MMKRGLNEITLVGSMFGTRRREEEEEGRLGMAPYVHMIDNIARDTSKV